MHDIFSENGVTEHGFQNMKTVAREKHLSTFHIYISNMQLTLLDSNVSITMNIFYL